MTPGEKMTVILDRVCDLYNITHASMLGGRRTAIVVRARHMAAALAFEFIHEWTMKQIALHIGMSAHTGVRYGLRKVMADEKQAELYSQLRVSLIEDAGDPSDWKPLDPNSK